MGAFPKPCLDCGKLTGGNSRCQVCETNHFNSPRQVERRQARRAHKAHLYTRTYQLQAKQVRESATLCYLCEQPFTPSDPPEADHLYPSMRSTSPLLAAHRTCNNKKSNRDVTELDSSEWPGLKRVLKVFPPSQGFGL